jgi:hypothetical protein
VKVNHRGSGERGTLDMGSGRGIEARWRSPRLTPPFDEVARLARQEASVDCWSHFQPICRGPLFAIVALIAIVLSAIPSIILRQIASLLQRRWTRDRPST